MTARDCQRMRSVSYGTTGPAERTRLPEVRCRPTCRRGDLSTYDTRDDLRILALTGLCAPASFNTDLAALAVASPIGA